MNNKAILEKLNTDRDIIESQIEELQSRLEAFDKTILYYTEAYLQENSSLPSINNNLDNVLYPKKGTWKDKVLFILKSANSGLRPAEIISTVLKYEPDIVNLDAISSNVSQTLWLLKKANLVEHSRKLYKYKEQ